MGEPFGAQAPSWEKRGVLWDPPGPIDWAVSHAALPILDPIERDRHWLYFSARDEAGRASIGRAEVALAAGEIEVVAFDDEPVLGPGPLGAFDDSGVTSSCVHATGDRRYLFYSGWSLGVTVPFYFYCGLAVSEDGGRRFERVSAAPVLERNEVDPYLTASPWVLADERGWRMWYVSGSGWSRGAGGEAEHRYHLKYAESPDGRSWSRPGTIAVDYADEGEHSISRPCVVRDGDRLRMWFAARGERYELGYAESDDGIVWRRDDELAGLKPSADGWDAEMICYPCVHVHDGFAYMLYNGNGYGRTGIGYAVAEAR
jgi:hypothetical protein